MKFRALQSLLLIIFLSYSSLIFAQYQLEWEDIFSYGQDSNTQSFGNGSDNEGNYYVGGRVDNGLNYYDFWVVKYNTNGDTLWTRTYDINVNNSVNVTDFYVDSLGNTYILGISGHHTGNQPYDVVTIKYNKNGDLQFMNIYDANLFFPNPSAFTIDEIGNIYVIIDDDSLVLIKYTYDGTEDWRTTYPDIHPKKIIVDNNGSILIAGNKTNVNIGFQDFSLLKFNSLGDTLWSRQYDRAGYDDYVFSLAIDSQNNIFIGGSAQYSQNYQTEDFAVIKYNADGTFQWERFYNGPSDNRDQIISLATDDSGNIIVAGNSYDSSFFSTAIIIKYSSSGDSLKSIVFNGSPINNLISNKSELTPDAKIKGLRVYNNYLITYGILSNTTSTFPVFAMLLKKNELVVLDIINYVSQNFNFIEGYAILSFFGIHLPDILISANSLTTSPPLRFNVATAKYSSSTNDVEDETEVPTEFAIKQNYPNPFNPTTKIRYSIPIVEAQNFVPVQLKVYDILGNEVVTLVNEPKEPGYYEVEFSTGSFGDASGLASGVYIYRLTAGNFVASRKMMLIR